MGARYGPWAESFRRSVSGNQSSPLHTIRLTFKLNLVAISGRHAPTPSAIRSLLLVLVASRQTLSTYNFTLSLPFSHSFKLLCCKWICRRLFIMHYASLFSLRTYLVLNIFMTSILTYTKISFKKLAQFKLK